MRAMRHAAIEAFYPDANLRVRHDDLGAILSFLPPVALPLLRRLNITLTPAQCYYWFGRAPNAPHPEWHIRAIAKSWPGVWNGLPPLGAPRYRADLRSALSRLASEARLTQLDLEIDFQAVYNFSQLFDGDGGPDNEECFRWTYELYVDVAEMVCAEFEELKGVYFRLATFADLEPWLARKVLGERFLGSVQPSKCRRRPLTEKVPSYHQMGRRLKGSHYHAD
ncbi:hypothetical protein N0V82_005121 [Gnomoniopsis sp. IMI 355080]|nr:hypothetical protein N0V82_005121 [Gnomoniopsis sp. IMI 355080]